MLLDWIDEQTLLFLKGIVTGFIICYFTLYFHQPIKPTKDSIPSSTGAHKRERKKLKEDCKMVLIVRTDLKMEKGKVAAQCSHATLDAYKEALKKTPDYLEHWESEGFAKITLKCPDEREMLRLQKEARDLGLVARSIIDAGRTQIAPGSRTVLAIGPGMNM